MFLQTPLLLLLHLLAIHERLPPPSPSAARYRLAARVVRLGYNVFLTDTDVIFFDDPYVYFKSPPFANYTVINQPEVRGGRGVAGGGEV